MTGSQFVLWLEAIKQADLARSDEAAGRLIGVTKDTTRRMKRGGTADLRTDLACAAVLIDLEPFGAIEEWKQE